MDQKTMVLAQLDAAEIDYTVNEHPAVYTIEEMEKLHLGDYGEIAKNLFLRNANGKEHYLIVLCHDKKADLKELRAKLGTSALSFASENRLKQHLGLTKGAVTPLGILNNYDCKVVVVLDNDLKKKERIGVHPNDNTATVWLRFGDIVQCIQNHGNEVRFLTI